jgi:glucose/arabinose dehydrogenase
MVASILASIALLAPAASTHQELAARPFFAGARPLTSIASTAAEPHSLYVTTKDGLILRFTNGKLRGVFLNLQDRVRSNDHLESEQGLLSLAFHPDYRRNHRFYVNYIDFNGDTRVVEFRSKNHRGVKSTARQLLFVDQPQPNHNGGDLQFDRNGLLYVGMGDGGEAGDPNNRAQNLDDRLGKILRIDPLSPGADWTPVGLGVRNPWRFSFDRQNGDLYIADVGTDRWEEIDYRPSVDVATLANYGWRLFEGPDPRFPDAARGPGELFAPVYAYNHDGGNCTVIGGFVYRGRAVPSARGRYFFGDFCTGTVWSLRITAGKAEDVRRESFRAVELTSFGEDPSGELYLATHTGRILKVRTK